jgi:hypothetical protein
MKDLRPSIKKFPTVSKCILFAGLLATLAVPEARAGEAALLLAEPFGHFGEANPTGHASVYLSGVCAETPTRLRLCAPGENGVVLSRYYRVGSYDWLAIPLIPYLYSVERSEQIPASADPALESRLRDRYRREHLMDVVPAREVPKGDWTQLIGAAYDRRIYGFAIETRPEQDEALIAYLNQHSNKSHFNLLFRNCANFSESILNFYYPHSIHRNFIADAGLVTPKQVDRSLTKYSRKHEDVESMPFVIQQVPGTIPRSRPVDGVVESLVKSKKYVLPLVVFHPAVTGALVLAYLGDGRFHPDPHAAVFNPAREFEPGEMLTGKAEPVPSEDTATGVQQMVPVSARIHAGKR